MQVAQHHEAGTEVLVECYRSTGNYFATGVVDGFQTASDRDYRVTVRGTGEHAAKVWRYCAPECVIAAIANRKAA